MKYLSNVVTLELVSENCTGCGVCTEVCPHDVFIINNNKKAEITEKNRCMECGACVSNCAFGALKVDKGVGCATAIINSLIYGGEPSCDCSGGNSACC